MPIDDRSQIKNDRRLSDSNSIDSELIGIIYEVALDPKFWPDLLESVAGLFEDRRSHDHNLHVISNDENEQAPLLSNQLEKGEAQRLAILLPHLYRALKLKRDFNQADQTRGQAQAILDQFPYGVLLVNADGRVISANQYALDTISESNTVLLQNGILCTTSEKQDQQLKELIYTAANTSQTDAGNHVSTIKIDEEGELPPISLLISPDPYPNTHYDRMADNYAAIFIASASVRQNIAESALQALFNLTPAESKLAALLASGASLNQASEQSYISKNTAKVQLKSIFAKMGISRQAELIKQILTSPAVFKPADSILENIRHKTQTKQKSHINLESYITLQDGRRLQYAEYGDPQGKPVIHLHGSFGCRYERFPDDMLTKNMGVRLIVPDRPGYGLSDNAPNHGYLDFADDLLELINHLELQKISVMGLSVGAIYGCAFAYKYPERLHNIAMINMTPPFRSFADFTDVPPSLKLFITFIKYLPTAAKMIAEIAIKNAWKDPEKFLANIPVSVSDQAMLTQSNLMNHITDCLLAGSKDNHYGFVSDILLSAEAWPFAIEDVKIEINYWHGTDDWHSPPSRIMPVINATPHKQLHNIKDCGHFLIYTHWQDIVTSLIE